MFRGRIEEAQVLRAPLYPKKVVLHRLQAGEKREYPGRRAVLRNKSEPDHPRFEQAHGAADEAENLQTNTADPVGEQHGKYDSHDQQHVDERAAPFVARISR